MKSFWKSKEEFIKEEKEPLVPPEMQGFVDVEGDNNEPLNSSSSSSLSMRYKNMKRSNSRSQASYKKRKYNCCSNFGHFTWYTAKHFIFSLGFLAWAGCAVSLMLVLFFLDILFNSLAWICNYFLLTYLRPISNPERYRRWYQRVRKSAIYWDWSKIDTRDLKFPDNFLWGTSTASHQVEGGCVNNNWTDFEQKTIGKEPSIKNNDRVGDACDHWNRLDEDLGLMQELGVNSYRFSLEWSKIEPTKGEWDQAALDHYHKEIDLYIQNGIKPFVTLHHFSEPMWFYQNGGFEKEENIQDFLEFCVKCYNEYGAKVEMWTTINEIEVFVNNGWNVGIFPPGKKNPNLAALVTLNLCRAHVAVYGALKNISSEKGWPSKIGLVKDIFQFDVLNWWNPLDHYLAWQMNHTFNDCIIDFFRTGYFHHWAPFISNLHYYDKAAISSNDFIGLNYYSHYCVSLWQIFTSHLPEDKLGSMPREIYTDMPHVMYPEGFYRALRELDTLKLPIIVTENGIADADDSRRQLYIARYMYAMSKAIRKGCNVQGYYYWSLMDNFEWSLGYGPKFGLYEVDFKTQKRTLRDGAKIYRKIIKKYNENEYRICDDDIEAIRVSISSSWRTEDDPEEVDVLHGPHRRPTM
mmetsp:Transcript_17381/g.22318  ORF Transcript_17381/g.22318 Transcript_17381/m.22318 type:complete len:633 (-) Transcript_17381:84-1982(-)